MSKLGLFDIDNRLGALSTHLGPIETLRKHILLSLPSLHGLSDHEVEVQIKGRLTAPGNPVRRDLYRGLVRALQKARSGDRLYGGVSLPIPLHRESAAWPAIGGEAEAAEPPDGQGKGLGGAWVRRSPKTGPF